MIAKHQIKEQPQSNHRLKMPATRDPNPDLVDQMLLRIQNERNTFRNLLANYVRKEHLVLDTAVGATARNGSPQLTDSDLKGDYRKLDNFGESETKDSPNLNASRAIKQISQRQIRTARRLVESGKKQDKSPRSSPAACYTKDIQQKQLKLPSPQQKSALATSRDARYSERSQDSPAQLRKSHLQFNPKNFKKNQDGSFVRLDNQELIQSRIKEVHPKPNQVLILNPTAPNLPTQLLKIVPTKSHGLDEIDDRIVKKYVRQMGLLDDQASSSIIFDYFNKLAHILRIAFQSPLIKKYKNCVYFGDNPTGRTLYEGLLYHYKSKLYFGSFLQGKKHGRGCEINFKQGIICRGEFRNGAKDGIFRVRAPDYEYEGDINNSLFEGKGVLMSKYSRYNGYFQKGYKHGRGEQQFMLSGEKYIGNYQYGKFDGIGQITNATYYYEGSFRNNLKHGQGYEKTSSDEYKGLFAQGKRHGEGVLHLLNGDSYRGQFKNGHINGKGQYSFSNGQKIHGYFVNGRMISEKNISRSHSKNRKLDNNLFQIKENSTAEEQHWKQQRNARQARRRLFQNKSPEKDSLNPEKSQPLVSQQNHITPKTSQKQQQKWQSLNRRGSNLERPPMLQREGLQAYQYSSTQRQSNPSSLRKSNNFMQLDYSLLENSVEYQPNLIPEYVRNKFRNQQQL